MSLLPAVGWLFARLSLLAVGGVNSTIPEIARQTVQVRHWLTPAQYSQLFAIAQAAPGPNMLIVTLIGAHVAGVAGGLLATVAMIGPAGVLVVAVSKLWDRFREKKWRRVIQAALLPITAGLVLAAAGVLARQADTSGLAIIITALSTALLWRTKIHPLWLLGAGALAGLVML
jgi:chromate transporter